MDNIQKFLQKLDKKKREAIAELLSRIVSLDLDGLRVQTLKGHKNLCKVRKGKIRIIFRKENRVGIPILVSFRDKAYRDL